VEEVKGIMILLKWGKKRRKEKQAWLRSKNLQIEGGQGNT